MNYVKGIYYVYLNIYLRLVGGSFEVKSCLKSQHLLINLCVPVS
jgi:hypothetical protein